MLNFIEETYERYHRNRPLTTAHIATEAAFAFIQYGFTRLNLQQIIGRALNDNQGSIKVLEKCGVESLAEEYVHGYLHKTYQATNPAIKS